MLMVIRVVHLRYALKSRNSASKTKMDEGIRVVVCRILSRETGPGRQNFESKKTRHKGSVRDLLRH